MNTHLKALVVIAFVAAGGIDSLAPAAVVPPANRYLSPASLVADKLGKSIYVGGATAPTLLVVDLQRKAVRLSLTLPAPVSGLALTPDERTLVVTCAAPESTICLIDTATGAMARMIRAGHHAAAPVVSGDGKTLFVCNRFTDDISIIDLGSGRERQRVRVRREPVAAALTRDGRHLLVANLLHDGRADVTGINAVISVIDVTEGRVVKELPLPDGGGIINDLRISPDGRHAAATHLIGRYHHPTSQVERGWINTNALTLVDLERMSVLDTILLDAPDRGAANPWGIGWTADGGTLAVAHSGLHEISVIDFPGVIKKLQPAAAGLKPVSGTSTYERIEVSRDLTFLATLRRRVLLPEGQFGPRALVVIDAHAWVANYFSDTLNIIDLTTPGRPVESLPLGPSHEMDPARFGELQFHNARLCIQGWQSCASCHPGHARVDGLNWDQLNDGLGNPKNNRSLLYTFKMSPVMSLGVRADSRTAVRAGVRHAMFTEQSEEVAESIDDYLESLRPVPSPRLIRGELSPAARRGEKLYYDPAVGCAECHPRGQFTDMKRYDVGTGGAFDRPDDKFYTPTLVEIWRTAPYLHDGSVATMRELLTTRNNADQHGRTSRLNPDQINDLVEYVLSL